MPTARLRDIPTNLIMGFLGVGKTTAILNLIEQKPSNETWAVLVNEFGKVGIDGVIYQAHGVAVKEIPGGCMCCAAGAPLQVGVNQLLKAARPDRLLIEPTGIGHPHRVLDTLQGDSFRTVLDLRASICLVDPRNIADQRYTSNENFTDQIAVADILIANKTDLADARELALFEQMANAATPPKSLVAQTRHGQLQTRWLDLPHNPARKAQHPQFHRHEPDSDLQSCGWILPRDWIFSREKLNHWLANTPAQRIKGLLNTEHGPMIVNDRQLTPVTPPVENRLEILTRHPDCAELKKQIESLKA